jgi:hypothetical protein
MSGSRKNIISDEDYAPLIAFVRSLGPASDPIAAQSPTMANSK